MRLYSTVCFGLVLIFFCNDRQPAVISDFCKLTASEVVKLAKLSDAEIAALARPRKEAILSLRVKYKRLCVTEQPSIDALKKELGKKQKELKHLRNN